MIQIIPGGMNVGFRHIDQIDILDPGISDELDELCARLMSPIFMPARRVGYNLAGDALMLD